MSGWTDEKIEELKRLWTEGLTTGEIGKRLDFSKNAVVGKAHRLNLESRPSPIKRAVDKKENINSESVETKAQPQAKKKQEKAKEPLKKKLVSIADLNMNSCRWPVGDPKEEGFYFCGKETFNGKPYCLEHCATAYVGISKKGG